MCEKEKRCEKGKIPEECSPEQIKECHGDTAKHECKNPDSKKKKE